MISANSFWAHLKARGFTFFAGVPCSILKSILRVGLSDPEVHYVPSVRENAALGVASGACMAGRKSGILIQNSGLGNIMNALTSFNLVYGIPVLMFITWRGYQGKDAPEHIIMGEKTIPLLKELGIPTVVLSENFPEELDQAIEKMEKKSIPVALILRKGIVNEAF